MQYTAHMYTTKLTFSPNSLRKFVVQMMSTLELTEEFFCKRVDAGRGDIKKAYITLTIADINEKITTPMVTKKVVYKKKEKYDTKKKGIIHWHIGNSVSENIIPVDKR